MEKVQKINILYLLAYIFVPLAIAAISILVGALFFGEGGNGAVICFVAIPLIAILWWIFGGSIIFRKKTKELETRFSQEGYRRNHTFYGRGKTVVLDVAKGMLGIAFFWNPTETYIVPASRVQKAWTDDGRTGSGFMEGSSRVSFVFTIDDINVRVDTFTSNQRFRMDDKYILTGISKADMMVKSIEDAKANSNKTDKSEDKSEKTESKSEKSETKSEKTETKSEKTEKSDKSTDDKKSEKSDKKSDSKEK